MSGIYSREERKFKGKENVGHIFIPGGIGKMHKKVSKIIIFILIKSILIGIFHDREIYMQDFDSNSIPVVLLPRNVDLTYKAC